MADKEVSKELKNVQKAVEKAGKFSAEKLIKYNVQANQAKAKEAEVNNQKLIKKQQDAIDMAEKRLKKKNITDEQIAKENQRIAEANAKKQEALLKKGPSDAKIELDATNDLISLMEEEFKETGKTRKDEKKMRALEKKKFQLELKMASPQARKEMLKEQAARDKRQLTVLQRIGQRLRGNEMGKPDDGGGLFEGPLKFLKGILLKGALLAFIMFLPKILDSKVMRDAIDLFQNKILPGLKAFYENVLKPLGEVLMELFGDLLGTIGELFDNIGATVQKFKDGDILGGILGIFETIFDFVTGVLDNGLTAIYNFFAKVFGFEETDSVFGSIKGFFGGLKDKVVGFFTETIPTFFTSIITKISESFTNIKESVSNFFSNIYDNVVSTISGIFSGITSFVSEKITAVIDYLKGIFGFDGEGFTFSSLFDLAFAGVNIAINLIKDIFSIGDPDTPFRLSEFIGGIFTKIGDFFRNLLDIDIRGLASQFLPKKAVDFLLGKDDEEAKQLAAAEESGLFEKRGMFKDSRIDKNKVAFAAEGQLRAILADDDLADEDKRFIEDELRKREVGARPQDMTSSDMQAASQNIAAMKMGGGMLDSGAGVNMKKMDNDGINLMMQDFGGVGEQMSRNQEGGQTNIVSSDNSVRSNSSNTVIQSETITPTYIGYSMTSAESDY